MNNPLRHAGTSVPGHAPTGIQTFRGTSPLTGAGATMSCFKCGKHRPQSTGRKIRCWGKLHWCCDDCAGLQPAEGKTK